MLKYCLLLLMVATLCRAAVISGTVKDSSGAITPRAHIEISGDGLSAPVAIDADAQGHFVSLDLKPGSYTLKVSANGFENNTSTVQVSDSNKEISVTLQVATLKQEVNVEGKASGQANNDPAYRMLRDAFPGNTSRDRKSTRLNSSHRT